MYASCFLLIPSILDMITVEVALKKYLSKDKVGHSGCREELESDRFASRAGIRSVHHA